MKFLVSFFLPYLVSAQTKCSFLPASETSPIEYSIPSSALSSPLKSLPIEFRGISPIVTRKELKYGESPKVVIERYSSEPNILYDEASGSVIVTSASCSSTSESAATATSFTGLLPTATALLAATVYPQIRPFAVAVGAVLGVGKVIAQEEACMPVVQVVVSAPSAYQGAVETCYEEINDPSICPDPFPTYPTCDDPAPTCKVAVVGGGAGGLYTALRMVDEEKVDASDVCIFEMTERVGGRLVSLRGLGPAEKLTVDAGGYRTWPEFTPTLHALITEYLEIPMECYDDSDPCSVYNIVDEDGNKAGFATFVEEMMQRLSDAGACFYPYHELTKVTKAGDNTELYFANGVSATATMTTILNIPQRPLLNVVRNSGFDDSGLLDSATLDALHSVQTVVATKFYLYYPRGHAWWLKLGLASGDFTYDGDARSMLLAGRYHDGHIQCDDENDLDTCHGFLLAVYANDLSGNKAQFFRRYQRTRPEPVTFISDDDLEGAELLSHAHARLTQFHLYDNDDAPYTGFEASSVFEQTSAPTFGVLSTWNGAIPWAGGAWHAWTDLSNIEAAQQPFNDDNIFVINEAYSLLQGWAEGSLKLGDSILEEYFDIPRPWSFPVVDLNQIVQQTNSQECAAVEDAGGSESSGGDSTEEEETSGADAALLCFTGDALVEMADGSLRTIQDVRAGDYVATGTGRGDGLVSEVLYHPVGNEVPVATLDTPWGKLTGTPNHPVLENDEWIEMSELSWESLKIENRRVEAFYNLEVDGLNADGSSHSYIVNGVVASGLGDNEELNKLFPRQQLWKDTVVGEVE